MALQWCWWHQEVQRRSWWWKDGRPTCSTAVRQLFIHHTHHHLAALSWLTRLMTRQSTIKPQIISLFLWKHNDAIHHHWSDCRAPPKKCLLTFFFLTFILFNFLFYPIILQTTKGKTFCWLFKVHSLCCGGSGPLSPNSTIFLFFFTKCIQKSYFSFPPQLWISLRGGDAASILTTAWTGYPTIDPPPPSSSTPPPHPGLKAPSPAALPCFLFVFCFFACSQILQPAHVSAAWRYKCRFFLFYLLIYFFGAWATSLAAVLCSADCKPRWRVCLFACCSK